MRVLIVVLGLLALRAARAVTLRLFAGHVLHSFFQPSSNSSSGCKGEAFFESVESYGGCVVKRDEGGRATGSYALFLCSAQEYSKEMGAGESGSDDYLTSEPTESPTPRSVRRPTAPSRRPSRRPSSRPYPRATSAVVRGLSGPQQQQPLVVNDQTLLVVNFTYTTPDCSGTEASTIATIYDQDPEKFLYPGLCRPSSRTTGTFSSGVRFSGRFVASQSFVFIDGESSLSYNVSSFAASAGRVAPPPLSVQGLVTEYFPDHQACGALGSAPLVKTVYAMGACLPGDRYRLNSSITFIDNYDWYTLHKFAESTDCTGKRTTSRPDRSSTCKREKGSYVVSMIGSPIILEKPVLSSFISSPAPSYLVALAAEFAALWEVKMAIAGLSASTTLTMLLLVVSLKKWTDFTRILLALACMQLCFDVCLLFSARPDAVVLGVQNLDKTYTRYIMVEFFEESSVTAVCLISNILSSTVLWAVFRNRPLPLRRYWLVLTNGIVVLATVPSAVLAGMRGAHLTGNSEIYSRYLDLKNLIQGLKTASIMFNVLAIMLIFSKSFEKFSFSPRLSLSSGRKERASEYLRKDSLTTELTRRLLVYPFVQVLTQLPVLWDDWVFQPKSYNIAEGVGDKSDDSFYKKPDYRVCWGLQFVLTPSAGIWFALAFVLLSKDVRRKLSSLLRPLRERICAVGRDGAGRKRGVSSISSLSFWATRDTQAAAAAAEKEKEKESESEKACGASEEEKEDGVVSKDNLAELDEQQLCDLIDAAGERTSRRIGRPLKQKQHQQQPRQQPPRGSVFPMQDSYRKEGDGDGMELVSSVSINPLVGLGGLRGGIPSPSRETQMTRISLEATGQLPIHSAIARRAPADEIVALITSLPDGASDEDEEGWLPLHLALVAQASTSVILALLQAYPEGSGKLAGGMKALVSSMIFDGSEKKGVTNSVKVAMESEGFLMLPLHLALEKQASAEVAAALLAAYPDAAHEKDKHGKLPLHLALEKQAPAEVVAALLKAYPEGAWEKTRDGRLPLYLAAENQAPAEVVAALLVAYPEGTRKSIKDGVFKLAALFNLYLRYRRQGRADELVLVQFLFRAAEEADVVIFDALLQLGVDVNQGDAKGRTPAYLASTHRTDQGKENPCLDLLIYKYHAVFLSKHMAKLTEREKRIRALEFAVLAGVLIGGFYGYLVGGSFLTTTCHTFYHGLLLQPYLFDFVTVFLFKAVQFLFEEVLVPAIDFVGFATGATPALHRFLSRCHSSLARVFPVGLWGTGHDEQEHEEQQNNNDQRLKRGSVLVTMGEAYPHQDSIPDAQSHSDDADEAAGSSKKNSLSARATDFDQGSSVRAALPPDATFDPSTLSTDGLDANFAWSSLVLYRLFGARVVMDWRKKKYVKARKTDPLYDGSDFWYQTPYLFLYLQGTMSFVSFVVAAMRVDRSLPAWEQYTDFCATIVNSGIPMTLFSIGKMAILDGRADQMFGRKEDMKNKLSRLTGIPPVLQVFFLPLLLLVAPFLTHILPAATLYLWTIYLFVLLLINFKLVLLQSLKFFGMSAAYQSYHLELFVEVFFRFFFIFFCHTLYDLAALVYMDGLSPQAYTGALAEDWRLRSQSQCFFNDAPKSSRGLVALFSWL